MQENTKNGSDADFCIFMMEMPVCYNFNYSESSCNDVKVMNGSINSLICIPNQDLIPEYWKSYVPSNYCFHVHNYCQVSYVKSGSMLYFINNKVAEVNSNELIIINAHMPHSWIATEGTEVLMSSFYPNLVFEGISESDVATVVNTIFSNQFPFISITGSCKSSRTVFQLFHEILIESEQKRAAYRSLIRLKLFEMSVIVLRDIVKLIPTVSNNKIKYGPINESLNYISDNTLNKAFAYIAENLQNNLSLNDVAAYVNMNASYFSHYFKSNTGISFTSFLKSQQLSRSVKLLLETELSISDIAFESGFNSISTFYQSFKSAYSISPQRFRKFSISNAYGMRLSEQQEIAQMAAIYNET